jgi:hypothetical protein
MASIQHADAPYTLSTGAQIITPPPPAGGPILYNGVGLIYNDNAITYNQG